MINRNEQKRLLAVVGSGVRESLSPTMHNYLFKLYGMDFIYTWIEIPSNALARFISIARNIYFGLNITIPFKESILEHMDYIDIHSKRIGAINTVKIVDSYMYGYNTDYEAIYRSIRDRVDKCMYALVIGAGGSAKASVYSLNMLGCGSIYVVNRTYSRALELCRSSSFHCEPINLKDIGKLGLREIDIIISAVPTQAIDSLGILNGENNILARYKPRIVIDLSYRPPCTKLLTASIDLGIDIVNGLEILSRQGAYAWRYWFNKNVDWKTSYRIILNESLNRYGYSCINAIGGVEVR